MFPSGSLLPRGMILTMVVAAGTIAIPVGAAEAQDLPVASPESVGMSLERLQRVTERLQRYIDEDLVAGAVSLVARQGKVVHYEAQGKRYREGGEAMPADALFVIMSMTKPIVSTALMMLFEEGHFVLDDPISKFLPGFEEKLVLVETDEGVTRVPAARPVTIRHVLTHTAGVDLPSALLTEEEREASRRRATLSETIMAEAPLPLAFHPGDQWRYGSSTDYVAMLVEAISGQRVDQFLQERILDPLGMVDTHYNVPEEKVNRVAAVYSPSGPRNTIELSRAPEHREPTAYFGGVAGLSSTAADYFRFAQMILNGGELDGARILSPTTVNLMISNHTGDFPIYIRGADAYGFGLSFSMITDPARAFENLTPGSFGWGGAWGTVFWIDPTEELISILMVQVTSYSHFNIRRDFPNMASQAITESLHAGAQPIRGYTPIER